MVFYSQQFCFINGIQSPVFFGLKMFHFFQLKFNSVSSPKFSELFKFYKKSCMLKICIVQDTLPSSSNMATLKQIKGIRAKVSKVSKASKHLDDMEVGQNVYEVLQEQLKQKRQSLDKKIARIKLNEKKEKFGERQKQRENHRKNSFKENSDLNYKRSELWIKLFSNVHLFN